MKKITLVLFRYCNKNEYNYYDEYDWSYWRLFSLDAHEGVDDIVKYLLREEGIEVGRFEFKEVDPERLFKLL